MVYLPDVSVFGVLIAISACLFVWLWIRSRRPKDFPPGPTPLPLIGNLNQFSGDPNILNVFRKLRIQYGDMFTMSIGTFWVIVVNGADNIKDLLLSKGDFLSDRPPLFINTLIDNPGVSTANGSSWKQQRKFALSKLRDFGFGKRSYEPKVVEEIEIFLKYIEDFNGKPFDFLETVNISVSNNVMSIVVGHRFDYNDPRFKYFIGLQQETFKDAAFSGPVNFIPLLAKIPGDAFRVKKIAKTVGKNVQLFKDEVQEHKATYDEDDIRDFSDAFLKEIALHKHEKDTIFTENQLVWLIGDFFAAGTETVSTAIKWAVMFLLNNVNVQCKMRKEIEQVVGNSRLPQLSDKKDMPYCDAVVHEVLRLGNIVPFGSPYYAKDDFSFKDYRFPKKSIIMASLDSILINEDDFQNCNEFLPERFIDAKGRLVGVEKVIAFSLGQRKCLGESLARMELFLYLTGLVQRFDLLPPVGENPPVIEGLVGILHSPVSYTLRAVARNT
ncbi:cytochrome P450 2D4-like isoform X1 [Mytilus californianus]|uniref:cytochrome P450 2D4-like isoform X1 n=1 Tax=Mytilus californianus TaxID=6549 RepID=UPI00224595E0|nr:cytochrome P450 2D4-like isoform X1 [Mytilus californianus]